MTADIKNLVSAYLYPWWLVLLEGLAALILGILFFTNTAMTTTVVWVFLGAWWLIGGIFALVSIFVGDNDLEWYWKLLKGIVGILAGLVVLRHPLITPIVGNITLAVLLGIFGVIYGGIAVWQAFKGAGWGVAVLGVLSIILGIVLILNPLPASLALPFVAGIFLVIGGILAMWNSWQIRDIQKAMEE